MRAVTGIDAGFLHTETPSTHWHVLGVCLIDDRCAREPFGAAVVRRLLADRLDRVEALRRRVVDGPLALTGLVWALGDVDLDAHVHERSLPAGAGLSELAALAGEIGSHPLPRDRPLWELTVVDGLAGDRKAMVAKIHHALVDGVAAMGVLGAILDTEPRPPPSPRPPVGDHGGPTACASAIASARSVVDQPALVARSVTRLAGSAWRIAQRATRHEARATLPLSAPRLCLSRSITARRAAAFASAGLADFGTIRRAFGVTFNDVAVAVTAGVLRRWLGDAGDLPTRPLVAAIPVSVRAEPGGIAGNEVSTMFGALPTNLDDAADRLRFVAGEMRAAKAFHEELGRQTLGSLATAAPWNLAGLLFRAYSGLGLANRLPPVVNLVLSSIPGPRQALYCGGARLEALFPLGPIFDGAALNVTVISYTDRVCFGFLTCPDTCPPVERLADAVPEAVAELVAAASGTVHDRTAREELAMDVQERNRQVLAAVRERRDEFYEAILALERAMASPVAGDPVAWASEAAAGVQGMLDVLRSHIAATEAPGGFYDDVVEQSPHLARAAERLRAEHAPLEATLDALVHQVRTVRDDEDVDAVRQAALDAIKMLLAHRHRGAELVYDAYNVDVAPGD